MISILARVSPLMRKMPSISLALSSRSRARNISQYCIESDSFSRMICFCSSSSFLGREPRKSESMANLPLVRERVFRILRDSSSLRAGLPLSRFSRILACFLNCAGATAGLTLDDEVARCTGAQTSGGGRRFGSTGAGVDEAPVSGEGTETGGATGSGAGAGVDEGRDGNEGAPVGIGELSSVDGVDDDAREVDDGTEEPAANTTLSLGLVFCGRPIVVSSVGLESGSTFMSGLVILTISRVSLFATPHASSAISKFSIGNRAFSPRPLTKNTLYTCPGSL
mmetsp:Transcript_15115/g.38337  ORF Transcript_15115/g.38337 Transcript_15115/m.38337 type:complete len:281 (+) Transcript_15115:2320-3162(+)